MQNKLTDVRAKADEARMAKLRANAALYEGLSAAYDFALDAEEAPEEYLRLVEAQGLKIQLRSPMKPVVKLAFDGMCDDMTIKQLEAVLAWAFDEELPRGTLAERIEAAGGIGPILSGQGEGGLSGRPSSIQSKVLAGSRPFAEAQALDHCVDRATAR